MAPAYVLMLVLALALAAPDWTDCPRSCRCKWSSGKKTAVCLNAGISEIPHLDEDIQVLDLTGNFIPQLSDAEFVSIGLINLQRIFLTTSGLRQVHPNAFKDLIILVEVDLSGNQISYLDPKTFTGNVRLRILILSHNPLTQLAAEQFPPLPHLRTLELEGCQLSTIHKNAFIHLVNLELLNLNGNHLESLSERSFMNFAHLKTLILDGNPWKCDCELRGFRDWYLSGRLHSIPLTCSEPPQAEGREWKDVKSEEFACPPQVFISPPNQVQAEAGGNVTLGCRVTGDPEPQVSWQYEGYAINHTWLVIEAEEGLLDKWANISVYNVSDVDVGVYTCVAKNVLQTVSNNVTLVLPEVMTAKTTSKSDQSYFWWGVVIGCVVVGVTVVVTVVAVCCAKYRTRPSRDIKASVSFTDQEKKLLDVSIATTTDRGTGSSEAMGPEVEILDPLVHFTLEREPIPMSMSMPLHHAVFPPPPEFSTCDPLQDQYGNFYISVAAQTEIPRDGDPAAAPGAARQLR
ncbi:reticulon-4 receptor-like 2 isoform X2 [Aethina tumida]|uniref:reticulon-4 receptor-like 2 isoform X2 n=1 Tax=Aethina tumida TaxID=116153 RepID=UPI002147F76F|nr:reticulon-4 receptor-like 2 isoform X2 [Aethina tumida]